MPYFGIMEKGMKKMDNEKYLDTLLVCGLVDKIDGYDDLICSKVDIKGVMDFVNDMKDKDIREKLLFICSKVCDRKDRFEELLKMVRLLDKYKGIGLDNFIFCLYHDVKKENRYRNFEDILEEYKEIRVSLEDVIGIKVVLDGIEYKVFCDKEREPHGICLEDMRNGEVVDKNIKCIMIKGDKYEIYKYASFGKVMRIIKKKEYDLLIRE